MCGNQAKNRLENGKYGDGKSQNFVCCWGDILTKASQKLENFTSFEMLYIVIRNIVNDEDESDDGKHECQLWK